MPPKNRQITSQYQVTALPGGVPNNPQGFNERRVLLVIQNRGVNEGAFWFDRQANSGLAFRLAPMASERFEINCPVETVFYASQLGTTFAVIEGYLNIDTGRS